MSITFIIIAVTVATSFIAFGQREVMRLFIMNPFLIDTQGQHYRFLTSGFIHNDYMHLLWNMITLYFFGGVVEESFGFAFGSKANLYFTVFYLMGIVISDVPTYFKHKLNPGYNALGASGGVASVVFASIIFQPTQDICLYFAFCVPGFILGALYIIYSYMQGRNKRDNINHDAHLYGAFFGFVFIAVMYPASLQQFVEKIMAWKMF